MTANTPPTRFWRATLRADALSIWLGLPGAIVTWILGPLDGWGMALSFLLALFAFPLALLAAVSIRQRKAIASTIAAFLHEHGEASAAPATGESGTQSSEPVGASVHAPVVDPVDPVTVAAPPVAPKIETAEERQAKHELAAFAVDHILPACEAQRALQRAIIRRLCGGMEVIEKLAKEGLDHDGVVPDFNVKKKRLSHAAHNVQNVSLDELMKAVKDLQYETYTGYCSLSDWLGKDGNIDYRRDDKLGPLYRSWKEKSDQLETGYERFRRDHRFPTLVDMQPKRLGLAFTAEP